MLPSWIANLEYDGLLQLSKLEIQVDGVCHKNISNQEIWISDLFYNTMPIFQAFCGLRKKKTHIRVIMVMFMCMYDEEFSMIFGQDHKKLKIHKKFTK